MALVAEHKDGTDWKIRKVCRSEAWKIARKWSLDKDLWLAESDSNGPSAALGRHCRLLYT
jgi:hypothetical protein